MKYRIQTCLLLAALAGCGAGIVAGLAEEKLPPPIDVVALPQYPKAKIDLSWRYSGAGVPEFVVYRAALSFPADGVAAAPATTVSLPSAAPEKITQISGFAYSDAAVTWHTAYYYRVQAVDGSGRTGDASDQVLAWLAVPVTPVIKPQPSRIIMPDTDSDGDGLADGQERVIGTDENNPDSDGDGLLDGAEYSQYHTNPLVADTDADGSSDKAEIDAGTDPRVNQNAVDRDGDGLSDKDEILYLTDADNPDSDQDLISDGAEVAAGSDPLDPASVPLPCGFVADSNSYVASITAMGGINQYFSGLTMVSQYHFCFMLRADKGYDVYVAQNSVYPVWPTQIWDTMNNDNIGSTTTILPRQMPFFDKMVGRIRVSNHGYANFYQLPSTYVGRLNVGNLSGGADNTPHGYMFKTLPNYYLMQYSGEPDNCASCIFPVQLWINLASGTMVIDFGWTDLYVSGQISLALFGITPQDVVMVP